MKRIIATVGLFGLVGVLLLLLVFASTTVGNVYVLAVSGVAFPVTAALATFMFKVSPPLVATGMALPFALPSIAFSLSLSNAQEVETALSWVALTVVAFLSCWLAALFGRWRWGKVRTVPPSGA